MGSSTKKKKEKKKDFQVRIIFELTMHFTDPYQRKQSSRLERQSQKQPISLTQASGRKACIVSIGAIYFG
jgi:hypothetical protein